MGSYDRVSDVGDIPESLDPDIKRDVERLISEHNRRPEVDDEDNSTSRKVSENLCSTISSLYEEGIPVSSKHEKDILDLVPVKSHTTIYYHINDKCSHETREQIKYDECGWMRFYASKGAPSKSLSVLFNISQKRAKEHIIGNCNHGDSCPPVDPDVLRKNSYTKKDKVTSVCPECEEEFQHEQYRERTYCSVRCRQVVAGRKAAEKVNGD